jgi:RNA polymerase sigma-70 factor (ECF subfamily)
MEDTTFNRLMERLRAGDDAAATRVFNEYAGRLIALARSRLDVRVRQKIDAEDVVQSVYRSFFCRHADGQFRLENWDSLWGMLVCITLRKCVNCNERFHAGRRSVTREVSATPADESGGWDLAGREPDPEEAVVLAETVTRLLEGFEGDEQEIVSLTLQQFSTQEISERLGRAERTVGRVRERARKRLERLLQPDTAAS